MNYISDRDLLSVWEFGINHSVIETNLLLLAYAYPGYDINQIASFSIGERDARLLQIREKLFGPILHNTSICTACGQKMEWEIPIDTIQLQPINEEVETTSINLVYKEHHISFRLPNSQDVIETINQDEGDSPVHQLIRKCIEESTLPPENIESIPEDLKNKLIQKMEENDPQANIVMNIFCAECDNEWNATFDIMQYLWTEINDWAIQLMQDIYLLASNFSWSENSILEMSRLRRSLFINMINR